MRCACIDIGTNTTRLLVAELVRGRLREVLAVRRFLPVRPEPDGAIAPETVGRLASAVTDHVRAARAQGADQIHAVATAAIRGAANRDELCAAIARAAGTPIRILSGDAEARLAFAGATSSLADPPDGVLGVVDVGGGSSELVAGTLAEGATWSASFALGSGILADRHLRSDPPAADELDVVRAEIDAALGACRPPRPAAAFAVGGSATSLRKVVGDDLCADSLGRALDVLAGTRSHEAARRFGVHVERARLLPAGLLLLEAACRAFGGAPLRVANGGLREGVVLQALARGEIG